MGSRRLAAAIASPSLVCAFSLIRSSSICACQAARSVSGGLAVSVMVASVVVVSRVQTDGGRGNHRLTQLTGCHKVATNQLLFMEVVMGFPDRIERTMQLAHPPAKVWTALTTADGLSAWFGNEAAIDLRPGGKAWMK